MRTNELLYLLACATALFGLLLAIGDEGYRDGFGPVLARAMLNEPRVTIGGLGFTQSYLLLDVGENVQKGISMHAALIRRRLFRGR